MVAVERCAAVLHAARRFFGLGAAVRVEHADAFEYLLRRRSAAAQGSEVAAGRGGEARFFSAVLVDLLTAGRNPPFVRTAAFAAALRGVLEKAGAGAAVALNCAAGDEAALVAQSLAAQRFCAIETLHEPTATAAASPAAAAAAAAAGKGDGSREPPLPAAPPRSVVVVARMMAAAAVT